MTSAEIIASVQHWELIRQDSELMITYFGQGNCYSYYFPEYARTSDFLHAYPGIYNNELYFFMIPSEYDKEEYHDTIDKYTTPCLLVRTVSNGDDRISSAQAQARIKAWEANYDIWTPAQVNGEYGIFEAFAIPAQDFEVENVVVFLGLKTDILATGGFEADLIIINDDGKQVVYDDFVHSVPPFDAAPTSQDEFYLLSANI